MDANRSNRRETSGRSARDRAGLIVVGMGEMCVSDDAGATLVTYSLGSCVGVAVYDPVEQIGGLLHAMLPDSQINPDRARQKPAMFVDTGLMGLFHAAYALGAERERLTIRIAGGAQFLDPNHVFDIGRRNISSLLTMLARNGLKPAASACGGSHSRTLRMELSTGQIRLDYPGFRSQML